MKTIYVTIAEFLENGGELKDGREIFNTIKGGLTGSYEFNSEFENEYNIWVISSNGRQGTVGCDSYYVAIECTPIYI